MELASGLRRLAQRCIEGHRRATCRGMPEVAIPEHRSTLVRGTRMTSPARAPCSWSVDRLCAVHRSRTFSRRLHGGRYAYQVSNGRDNFRQPRQFRRAGSRHLASGGPTRRLADTWSPHADTADPGRPSRVHSTSPPPRTHHAANRFMFPSDQLIKKRAKK
ncbi:hypothetical protein PVAP13_2NG226103 [Panicum virgatum]|uniref:Uncharacterized protein n=1 Tax=Panicum virgatum TaxID=38727 RepID=A0A8T0VMV9_PANVG|nr:hypothetical protein PVAP13_2NG226103 [Panicum virgatum]KAG2633019.1 hypothetical protein PVAP13_2NG226103 [Panicum virgatum]